MKKLLLTILLLIPLYAFSQTSVTGYVYNVNGNLEKTYQLQVLIQPNTNPFTNAPYEVTLLSYWNGYQWYSSRTKFQHYKGRIYRAFVINFSNHIYITI